MSLVSKGRKLLHVLKFLQQRMCHQGLKWRFKTSWKSLQRMKVGQLFTTYFPEASVTLGSSDICSTNGLLERENAAILNETFKPLCRDIVSDLTQVVDELCLGCPLFFTRNDGSIMRLKTGSFKEGKVGVAAFMGAPTVGIEKIPHGREMIEALECIEMILKTDLLEDNKQKLAVKQDDNIKYITDFDTKSMEVTQTDARGIVALMCLEIGGTNAMETLCVGADMGLPILDCDGMGRAFPELQMYSPSIYGHPMYPAALVDEKGKKEVVLWVKTTKDMEEHLRKTLGRMGSLAAISVAPLTGEAVLETCIMFSITRAFKLGDAVLKAKKENRDPVESICEHEAVHLITGKVSKVCYKSTVGFDHGIIEIEGTGKYADQEMIIDFQNENLIAKRRQAGEETVVVTTPDIITVVDIDTGRAITNEEIKNGMHVAVIALASPPRLRTEAALKFVGPQVFGCNIDFTPIREYHSHGAIPPSSLK